MDKSRFSQENRPRTPVFRGKNIDKWGVPGKLCPDNSVFGGCFEKMFEDLSKSRVPIEPCPGDLQFSMFFPTISWVPGEVFPRTPIFGK